MKGKDILWNVFTFALLIIWVMIMKHINISHPTGAMKYLQIISSVIILFVVMSRIRKTEET